MESLLAFFRRSQQDKEELKIRRAWNGPRNYQSVGFGMIHGRPYWLMRDRSPESSEFRILFSHDKSITVNVAFKEDGAFWFDAGADIQVEPEYVEQALFRLFEFIVWDAIRKDAGRIYGSFGYKVGWDYTYDPILKALGELKFMIHHDNPIEAFCLKVYISDAVPLERAWLHSGITHRKKVRTYGQFAETGYHFICLQPEVPDIYNYRLQIDRENFCTIQCRVADNKLVLAAPSIHLQQPVLYSNLVEHIVFDAIHQNLSPCIEMIECEVTNDMVDYIAPCLGNLEFKDTLKINPTYRLIL